MTLPTTTVARIRRAKRENPAEEYSWKARESLSSALPCVRQPCRVEAPLGTTPKTTTTTTTTATRPPPLLPFFLLFSLSLTHPQAALPSPAPYSTVHSLKSERSIKVCAGNGRLVCYVQPTTTGLSIKPDSPRRQHRQASCRLVLPAAC